MLLAEIIIVLSLFFLLTWVFIAFAIYFLPLIVAHIRQHNNIIAIAILNIVLGWTFIGWLAALLWACNCDTEKNNADN